MNPNKMVINTYPLPEIGSSKARADYTKICKLVMLLKDPSSANIGPTDIPMTVFSIVFDIMKLGGKYGLAQDGDICTFIERIHLQLYKQIVDEERLEGYFPINKLSEGSYEGSIPGLE